MEVLRGKYKHTIKSCRSCDLLVVALRAVIVADGERGAPQVVLGLAHVVSDTNAILFRVGCLGVGRGKASFIERQTFDKKAISLLK